MACSGRESGFFRRRSGRGRVMKSRLQIRLFCGREGKKERGKAALSKLSNLTKI